jgi:hypothetical protein
MEPLSIDANGLNRRLEERYRQRWGEYLELRRSVPGVSLPLLASVPPAYPSARLRVMIVGQQSDGWETGESPADGPPAVEQVIRLYRDFNFGGRVGGSPFWQAAREVTRKLNGGDEAPAFLWSNLVKADVNRGRPAEPIAMSLRSLGWLRAEIEICRPHAVVFFTGPSYDDEIQAQFEGARFSGAARKLQFLELPGLDCRAARTYHPKYLRLRKLWEVLDDVVRYCRGE